MDLRREEIAATFDLRARGYRESDWHRASAERLVDLCGLKPGDRVLDAGTGTGFAAHYAARQVGKHGRVVGVDISQGMLSEARAEAAASSLGNIEFIQCDATALTQFPDAAFDVVTSATSLIYIPVIEGLREWHRVLGHGGLIAFSTMPAGFPVAGRLFRECAGEYGVRLEIRAPHLGPMVPAEKPSPLPGSLTPKRSPSRSSSPSATSSEPGSRTSARSRTSPWATSRPSHSSHCSSVIEPFLLLKCKPILPGC